jgi:hypothetical protein
MERRSGAANREVTADQFVALLKDSFSIDSIRVRWYGPHSKAESSRGNRLEGNMSLGRIHSVFGRIAATGVTALCLFLAFPAFVIAGESAAGRKSTPPTKQVSKAQVVAAYGKLPLNFEANQGQTDPRVKFLSRGRGYALFLTGNEAVLSLRTQKSGVRSEPQAGGNGKFDTGNSLKASRQSPVVTPPSHRPTDNGLRTTDAFVTPLIQNPKSQIQNLLAARGSRVASPESPAPSVLRLKLVGTSPNAKIAGLDELPGKSNYFLGNDPKKWRTNLPTYAKVRYENVYPGIDLVYYGNQRQLECDFIVAPGADPRAVRVAVDTGTADPDAAHLRVTPNGDLVIAIDGGEIRFRKPVVYQIKSAGGSQQSAVALNHQSAIDNRQFLDGRYVLRSPESKARNSRLENRQLTIGNHQSEIGFEIARYDASRPLIIDPVLSYSTYLGGSDVDEAAAIAVDGSGYAYLMGDTTSADFPIEYPEQRANAGLSDIFVTKIDAAGSVPLYSTYLGGSADDTAYLYGGGIAVDTDGNAYITGGTSSTDFPITIGDVGPFQRSLGGGTDAFVAKLDPTGSALVYSTYLGGSAFDHGGGIAIDSSGNAYVAGQTYSPTEDFPLLNPLQPSFGGSSDAFVASLNPTGSALNYSTYLGGSADDFAFGIAVDGGGNAYLTGRTYSSNFPTANAYQAAFGGVADAFVAKVAAGGTALLYSTYLGGSAEDGGIGIAADSSGDAYVAGWTYSSDFPTTIGAYDTSCGTDGSCNFDGESTYPDAFVASLDATGSALNYSTFVGGTSDDTGYSIAVDSSGNAYVTGNTSSTDFPTASPLQDTNAGAEDVFVTKLNSTGSAVIFSTYLGGSGSDHGTAIAVDSYGDAYVAGATASIEFPTTTGAYDGFCGTDGTCNEGASDAFVAKLTDLALPIVTLSLTSLDFGSLGVGFTSAAQTVTLTNNGDASFSYTSAVTGDFAVDSSTTTCPIASADVSAGASCTFDVTFTPTAIGPRTGELILTDSAPGTPHTVSLSGTGVAAPAVGSLTPSVDFGDQTVGVTSAEQPVTLTNNGTAPLTINTVSTAPAQFTPINHCPVPPAALAVGASCSIGVTFTPTATGAVIGTLTIDDDAPGNPHTVVLTGTGVLPNPVPHVNQPLVPLAAAPGGAGFTLTVNGTGFVSGSVVKWNGAALATTFVNSGQLTATVPAANVATAGTVSVTAFSPTPGGGISNALFSQVTDATPSVQVSRTDLATGGSPFFSGLTEADLNGDGKVDLIVVQNMLANYSVSVFLGNGDGTFQTRRDNAVGARADGVTAADFNGDGLLDLAVTRYYQNTVAVLLGNGDGTFQPLVESPTGPNPWAITTGDFDGDGKLDLAVRSLSSVSVLLGNGDGTFPNHLDFATGSTAEPLALVTGDFNLDGKLDLAAANSIDSTASVLLGNGDGTFQPHIDLPTGTDPRSITTADFNGDGKLDLAIANRADSTVSVLLGNGDGTFQAHVDSATDVNPEPMILGDFNGDGKLDIATGNTDTLTLSILLGNGDGTFQPPMNFAAGNRPVAVTGGDFNRDGRLDLAAANDSDDTVSILLQAPVVSLPSTSLTFASQVVGTSSTARTVTLTNTGSASLAISGLRLSGPNAGDFAVGGDCPVTQLGFPPPMCMDSAYFFTAFPVATPPFSSIFYVTAPNADGDRLVVGAPTGGFDSIRRAMSYIPVISFPNEAFCDFIQLAPGMQVASYVPTVAERTGDFSAFTGLLVDPATGQPVPNGVIPFSPTPSFWAWRVPGNAFRTGGLPAGASCNIDVTSSPTTTGPLSAVVTVADSAAGAYQSISLTGTGIQPAVSLSPTSVGFTGNPLNLDCPSKAVTLTNTGDVSITLVSIAATPPFSVAYDTCPTELGVGEGCTTIQVKFYPTVVGPASGTLTVTTDPPVTSGNTVSLSGNGLPACQLLVKARSVKVLRGTDSTDFDVSDSKPSCSPTNFNLTCTADNPALCALDPTVIPPSGTSRLTVANLRAVTAEAVRVVVNSLSEFRAASETVSVLISDFAFTRAPERASVRAGESTSYALVIRPVNGLEGSVQLSCSGAPRGATCSVTPSSVTLDGSSLGQATVRVTTTARALAGAGRQGRPPLGPQAGLPLLGLVSLAGLAMLMARRQRVGLVLGVSLLLVLVWVACGGGGFMLTSSGGGTPAGTYALTITGSYSTSFGDSPLTHGTTVTLTVN